ncbi:MAG: ParA family protein [Deltaproteobacteria bacterium]|nr:ParA family protein [Deltaproteobacteria bacterium]MBK8714077.1 ParA family protein [Deltaproteobacteria bacterium]MBP7285671.1 ParA family protein [Nannocystaceae bacterium]
MRTLAFFNNKGGVGKTTLVYHFAHMLAESGIRVLVVDLDPQSNLTAMCLPEERLEQLWPDTPEHASTVLGCLRPILRGTGDVGEPHIELLGERLGLVPGDLGLSQFEDKLSDAWPRALNRDEAAFRTLSAFHRIARRASDAHAAAVTIIDVGPNLGAINRAALLAAQHVVTPLAPDLFSVQGLRNLGPTLADWRRDWKDRLDRRPAGVDLPDGGMNPLGYVLMQAVMRLSRPVRAYERWVSRMPAEYHRSLLMDQAPANDAAADPACLGIMKNYQSLMPLAHDAHKPMFALKPADGAIGAHAAAVARCRDDFHALTTAVLQRIVAVESARAGALPRGVA